MSNAIPTEGAGKGDKWRKDAKYARYYRNLGAILEKPVATKSIAKKVIQKNNTTIYVY